MWRKRTCIWLGEGGEDEEGESSVSFNEEVLSLLSDLIQEGPTNGWDEKGEEENGEEEVANASVGNDEDEGALSKG